MQRGVWRWQPPAVPRVSLEQDAAYRRDGGRYVEICGACSLDRSGDACTCGAKFSRLQRKFLTLSWQPTVTEPVMPAICPHCEGPTDRRRSVTLTLPTAARGVGGATYTRKTIEIPSCRRMLPPFLAYLGWLTAVFLVVVLGLVGFFDRSPAALIGFAISVLAAASAWRAYGWVRFVGFDHRALRFRVRRRGYARALADANRGRVL